MRISESYMGPESDDFVQIINHRKEKITFRYERGRQIGKGGFGECYQARKYEGISLNETQEVVVIKRQIKAKQGNLSSQKSIKNDQHRKEIRINKILNSASKQYFPKYKNYWSDENYYYTVMQKIELGSLESLIKQKIPFRDQQILYFIRQILEAIHLMHKQKMLHCDLKGGNILVNKLMKIKIIDFGLSEIGLGVDPKATKRSGTPAYMAPEIVEQNENGYSYSVDVWSIGILLHYMIFGQQLLPYRQPKEIYQKLRNQRKIAQLIERHQYRNYQNYKKSYSLMKKMLIYSATQRPSVAKLLEDEVFQDIDYQEIQSYLIKKFNSHIEKCSDATFQWKKIPTKKQNLKLKQQYKVRILYLFRHENYGYFYVLSNGLVRAFFNDQQDMLFNEGEKENQQEKMFIISQIFQYVLEDKRTESSNFNKIKSLKNKEQPNCRIVSLIETNNNLFVRLSNGTLQVFFFPQRQVKEDNFYSYELIISINNNQTNINQILFESDDGDFIFNNFDQIKNKPSAGPQIDYIKFREKYQAYIIYIKKVMKVMLDSSQLHLKDYGCEINYGQKK